MSDTLESELGKGMESVMKWISDGNSHRITVAVVDSPAARAATRWAAREAGRRGFSLLLVHVDSPSDDGSYQARGPAVSLLSGLVDIAEQQAPAITVRTTILTGRVASTLLDLSRRAAMIVVGCEAHASHSHARIDSVTAALMRRSSCPVAIVRSHSEAGALGVVVVTDALTPSSILGFSFDEAVTHDEQLTVIDRSDGTAGRQESLTANVYGRSLVDYASLAQRLARWRTRYPTVDVRIVSQVADPCDNVDISGSTAQMTIVESESGPDVFGRTLNARAEQVVLRCPSTVIVVPAR